jgi:apolipoprotein D and lipocalin family protein
MQGNPIRCFLALTLLGVGGPGCDAAADAAGGGGAGELAPDAGGVEPPEAQPEPDSTIGAAPEAETVAYVEVAAYLGTWYEIASIPQGFQRNCAGTTATYGVVDAATVSVRNRCLLGGLDGPEVTIEGTAAIVDSSTNAKLAVDFGFGGVGPAPYWIVDLGIPEAEGAAYPWAIVSNPDRSALWIINRQPVMPAARFETLIARLEAAGYAPARLSLTEQAR